MYPSEDIVKLGHKDSYSKNGVFRGVPQLGVSYSNDVLAKVFDLNVYSDTKRQHIVKEGWSWSVGSYPKRNAAAQHFAYNYMETYGEVF